MLEGKNRKIIIASFIAGAIFLIAILINFWGAFIEVPRKESMGALPLIYTIISLAAFSYLFKIALALSNSEAFESIIEQKVTAGRAALLQELNKEDDDETNQDEDEDIQETVKALLPSGNFKNVDSYGKKLLVNLANKLNLVQAVIYIADGKTENFAFNVGYALPNKAIPADFTIGENLNGEAAKNQEIMVVSEIPEAYFNISSGLGETKPGQLIIVPIVSDKKTIALIELASFGSISGRDKNLIELSTELIANKLKQLIKA